MLALFFILAAATLRFLPHLPNFAPITAMALFGGAYLNKKYAIVVPLLAMLVSDYFIGFYNPGVMAVVYGSFALSGIFGLWLKQRKTLGRVAGVTLLASVQFFLLTNAAVWAFGDMYPHTLGGLFASYANGLPFFRGTLFGDFFYVGVMFSSYELVRFWLAKRVLLSQK